MTSADKDIAGYLEHLQTQRKLSAHTLDNYRRDLEQLALLVAENVAGRPLAKLTQADIRRCTSQLHARGLSPS
jgi:integrase/recombinase XerC